MSRNIFKHGFLISILWSSTSVFSQNIEGVFSDVKKIKQEPKMTTTKTTTPENTRPEKNQAKEYLDNIKALKIMFWAFLIFIPLLYALNIWTEPEFLWIWIVAAGWGAGFPLYVIIIKTVFGVFDLGMTDAEAERHFNSGR